MPKNVSVGTYKQLFLTGLCEISYGVCVGHEARTSTREEAGNERTVKQGRPRLARTGREAALWQRPGLV